ncbi:MAG: DedA family protein [Desulfobacterota bacterium]|nr:DedA family protein [Thermodesulfobacteriota bacterium]
MEDFFIRFVEHCAGMPGYALLAVFACIENLVPPMPGDTITVFGGYLAATGRLNLAGAIAATTIGSWAGFLCMLWCGRRLGEDFFLAHNRRLFPKRYFFNAFAWFRQFGYGVVLANRFLPGARSVISICAGIVGLHAGWVALCSLISCLVWNSLLIGAGYMVGENWQVVLLVLRRYNTVILTVGAAVLLYVVIRKFRHAGHMQKKD